MSDKNILTYLGTSLAVSLPQLSAAILTFAQARVKEVIVLGRQEFLQTEFTAKRTDAKVDAAKLMNSIPAGTAANKGPLTAQIHFNFLCFPTSLTYRTISGCNGWRAWKPAVPLTRIVKLVKDRARQRPHAPLPVASPAKNSETMAGLKSLHSVQATIIKSR